MDRWIANVKYINKDACEEIGFINRPIVTEGSHHVRIQSLDREVFVPVSDVERIDVATCEEDGLIEMLEGIDADAVTALGLKMQESDDDIERTSGKLLTGVVRHAKLVDQVAQGTQEAA